MLHCEPCLALAKCGAEWLCMAAGADVWQILCALHDDVMDDVSWRQVLMEDPVLCRECCAEDDETYERAAIAQWLRGHDMSPMRGTELRDKSLRPNMLARRAIEAWTRQHCGASGTFESCSPGAAPRGTTLHTVE